MHKNRGKTLLSCLAARTDYAMDKDKTADGELVSSYECAPQTAAEEFALSKQIYFQKTGREQANDVSHTSSDSRSNRGKSQRKKRTKSDMNLQSDF